MSEEGTQEVPQDEASEADQAAIAGLIDDTEDAEVVIEEAEVEAEADDDGDEAETDGEADDEQTSDDDADEDGQNQVEPDYEAQRRELWDKELQAVQQRMAAHEQAMQRFATDPTPENREKVEKAKSRIDELLEQPDDDLDPYKGVKTVAEETRRMQQELEQTRAQLQQFVQSQQQSVAKQAEQVAELKFAKAHPDLADRYGDLRQELVKRLKPIAVEGGGQIPDATWNRIVNTEWEGIVIDALASVAPPKADVTPEEKVEKPKGTTPVQTKSGGKKKPPKGSDASYKEALASLVGD